MKRWRGSNHLTYLYQVMKRIPFHIIFWVIILFWRANGDYFAKAPYENFVWMNLLRLPIIIIATYVFVYVILPKYIIESRQYLKFGFYFLLNFLVAFYLDKWLLQSDLMKTILDIQDIHKYKVITTWHPYRNSFMLLSIMGLAAVVQFFNFYREKEKQENKLIQEQLEMQHAFLKAQVNPHFLFNALNNLYSMAVQKNQKEIAEGLDSLSGIMHYLTYQSSDLYVPLSKEIKLVQDYLDIQRLRIAETDDITISFTINGKLKAYQITPVVLLPLVENAFKHGVKPEHKCMVKINLNIENGQLDFEITNRRFEKSIHEINEKGIGLDNVRKRLEMAYGNQFQLSISETEMHFKTQLQISL